MKNFVLRQHQSDALVEIQKVLDVGSGKGRIVLPTGTGKTRIEAEIVCRIIKDIKQKGGIGGVHVVLSPRILLAYQQLDEFLKIVTQDGIPCDYMVVNSGGLDSGKYEQKLLDLGLENPEEIGSTTSQEEIAATIQLSARVNQRPLVIFSTYHSVGRVDGAARKSGIKIQSYIFDEAQYCVTAGDFKDALDFESVFKFFFTATEKWTDDEENGYGMNNENRFGKLVFEEKPRTMIERGEMASVAIHEVMVSDDDGVQKNEYEAMAKAIVESFDKHREVMKAHSFSPASIGPKMIVVCNKQFSLKGVMHSKTLKDYRLAHPKINLCALSSDFGIEINGISKPRANNREKEILLAKMRSWKSEDEAIVLHVDMIGEGIDVPGITAIMPFRNFGKIKFLQNLGRGTRLIGADRSRLYSGEIKATDLKPASCGGKYVKPYCWLVLPVLSSDYADMKKRYMDYIQLLRANYKFDTNEMVDIEPPGERNDGYPPPQPPGKWTIRAFIHEIEYMEKQVKIDEMLFDLNKLNENEKAELFFFLGK